MTVELMRHGLTIPAVYDLLGRDENDLTAALGHCLANSPQLRRRLVHRLIGSHRGDALAIRLETHGRVGRTDLELDMGDSLIVIEAKRGWLLPGESQLAMYAPRIQLVGAGALVSLSHANDTWAAHNLPAQAGGIPVQHVAWATIRQDLRHAIEHARGTERVWLKELDTYLRRAAKVTEPQDSRVYCVSVGQGRVGGSGPAFREFVQGGVYFHPYGISGWPREAPNFMAFRWENQVRQINRVTSSEVIPDLQTRWPDIPVNPETARPHAVYTLGPALPGTPIPTGANYQATRMTVLLDQLLTAGSLRDALAGSKALMSS